MHEFELGVWKSLFIHLIRILYATAQDGSLVSELDCRSAASQLKCKTFSLVVQISTGPYIQQEYHSKFRNECLQNEETGSPRL